MNEPTKQFTRAPHLLGQFGEGLVTYLLIRHGFEVAVVNHVGADLIAEKENARFAVSVKTRLFRPGSKESRNFVVDYPHIEKLTGFANRFDMRSLFAQVVCESDQKLIQVFVFPVDRIRDLLQAVQHGFALRCQRQQDLTRFAQSPGVIYARWREESLGEANFSLA
jgi:Holliday junction resolvase